jgi:hypothetical protein
MDNKSKLVPFKVGPKRNTSPGKWQRFKDWLSTAFRKEVGKISEEFLGAGHGILRGEDLKAKELDVPVELEPVEVEKTRAETEKIKAEAKKTRIEALFLEPNSITQLIKEASNIGLALSPVYEDEKLIGFVVGGTGSRNSKLIPEKKIPPLPRSRSKNAT